MDMAQVRSRGLVLLGCGKMGSAMLQGWLADGFPATSVTVVDPNPSAWLGSQGVRVNEDLPTDPAIVLVAVKPQMMAAALPGLAGFGGGETLFLSVAAGTPISFFEATLGPRTPVIRAMPNTPAAVGRGITAIIGNERATESHLELAEQLLSAVSVVVRLETEAQMDAVTALSGSGPAYVFHLVEAMARAGVAEGLPPDLAMRLARATVEGAGELLHRAGESAAELRANVTSPGGTTAAALEVLMSESDGFPALLERAVGAAAARSRELAR